MTERELHGYDPSVALITAPLTAAQRTAIIGNWNYYKPTTQNTAAAQRAAARNIVYGMLAQGNDVTAAYDQILQMITQDMYNNTGTTSTSDATVLVKKAGTGIANTVKAIDNALPWYLHPTNVLLMGGGAVVLYFTWPILLKMGFGTVKRGVKAFNKPSRA